MRKRPQILIVDDDAGYAPFYLEKLNALYDIVLCTCMSEFNKAVSHLQIFDLTIIDVNFDGGGFELLRKLNKGRNAPHHQIVVHSDGGDEELIQQACKEKHVEYIPKPSIESFVLKRISNALKHADAQITQQEKLTVLVIDDDVRETRRLQHILKDEFEVKVANSANAAIKLLTKDASPDLIILDMVMKQMHGLELLQHIVGMDTVSDVPVVCLSGKNIAAFKARAIDLGAYDYLTKPYNIESLIKTMKNAVSSAYVG